MISAIKKFKEENEIPVEDEQILSADDSSISDLSNSKLRDLIRQEMASIKPTNDSQSDITTHQSDHSKTIDDPLPKEHARDHKPKEFSRPVEPTKIKLPKKSKNSSHSVRRRPMRPLYIPQQNTELQPINIQPKTKADLIPYSDERIRKLLEEQNSEICYISPISTSKYVTPDSNMKRCQILIETLNKNDYLYFPIYLYDFSSKQIMTVVFMVFNATVKKVNLTRTFNDMFNLMTLFSRQFSISNLVYCKQGRFVLRKNGEYSYLDLKSSEEAIKSLCGLNDFKVDEYCRLFVNPLCTDKEEYLQRHISKNELCGIDDYFSVLRP